MNIDTSWSKLLPTAVGEKILSKMDSDTRLLYHNGDHVRRMYARAKFWRLPYDVTLDAAFDEDGNLDPVLATQLSDEEEAQLRSVMAGRLRTGGAGRLN